MSNSEPLPLRLLRQGGSGGGGALGTTIQVLFTGDSHVAGTGVAEADGVSIRGGVMQKATTNRTPLIDLGRNNTQTAYGIMVKHEGYGGLPIGPNAGIPGYSLRELLPVIAFSSPTVQVLAICIGGVDVLSGLGEDADTRIGLLVDEINGVSTTVKMVFLVPPIPTFVGATERGYAADIVTALVAKQSTYPGRIAIVDARASFDGNPSLYFVADAIHMSRAGADLLVPAIYNAIRA